MTKHMLVMELACPLCGAGLTEGTRVHLDGYLRDANREGVVYLSAVFGDYSVESELDIREGAVVDFRCPRCEADLAIPLSCKLCKAPMISLDLRRGGYLELCTRRGCRAHALGGTGDVDDIMNLLNRMFETPYD